MFAVGPELSLAEAMYNDNIFVKFSNVKIAVIKY